MTGSVVADVLMDLIDQGSEGKKIFTDKDIIESIDRAKNQYGEEEK